MTVCMLQVREENKQLEKQVAELQLQLDTQRETLSSEMSQMQVDLERAVADR